MQRLAIFLILLVISPLVIFWIIGNIQEDTHEDAFTDEFLLEANAEELNSTVITPHLEAAMVENQNVLWCGTFQLAWNEVCSLIGEDIHLDNEPEMVSILNQRDFTKKDLDNDSYIAVAGFIKDDVFQKIDEKLQAKFQGKATPRHLPANSLTPRPQDIVAYAYLFKNIEFPTPYERIEEPITFDGTRVPCFGVGEDYKSKHEALYAQFRILDYQEENDFIIELMSKSPEEQIILAKISPSRSLKKTIDHVRQRIANRESVAPSTGDVLKIPKLNFDLTKQFLELEGNRLLVSNPAVAKDLVCLSALQNIRFQFDEKGVRLRSESHLSFGCSAAPGAGPPTHRMVFDRPFLILMKRKSSEVPYFALWIANPSLLMH